MVCRTSPANWTSRHGGAVESDQLNAAARSSAPPASCCQVGYQQHRNIGTANDAGSFSWRFIHVAAPTGLVALWLCGG